MRNAQSRDRYTKAVKIIPPIKVYNERQKKSRCIQRNFPDTSAYFFIGFYLLSCGAGKAFRI